MLALILQAASFLPPALEPAAEPDRAYLAAVRAQIAAGEIGQEEISALTPDGPGQRAALAEFAREGTALEVRAAALLGAGAPADSRLSAALCFAGCELRDEAAALGALLAPAAVPPEALPALAYLAHEPDRPLAVRAAAVARLLDADCGGVWPVARSVLRTGTELDEEAPWVTWERTGRYELPKRVLLLSLDAWLERHGESASGYEPNASWDAQLGQLRRLEAPAQRAAGSAPAPPPAAAQAFGLQRLRAAAAAGDVLARRALVTLGAGEPPR